LYKFVKILLLIDDSGIVFVFFFEFKNLNFDLRFGILDNILAFRRDSLFSLDDKNVLILLYLTLLISELIAI
jgi:hypothetical protein